jgi:hopanoid-associated phosphorylase
VTILIATGLKREAQILGGPGLKASPGGGRSAGLEAALLAAAEGAEAIVSLGIGGALASGLQPGDWVVATEILADGLSAPTDAAWTAAIAERVAAARTGAILGSEVMLTRATDKADAHRRTGALAIDMESHVAARLAGRLGLPFAAARVVSDAADRDLPDAVKVGMTPEGGMALGAVLWALARRPAQLPALIRAGREAQIAFRALSDGRHLLGPRIGLPDLAQLPLDVA